MYFYLFMAVLGLCCCSDFSLVLEWGVLSSCNAQASHWGGFSCWAQSLDCSGFRSCGSRAPELNSLWCMGLVALWYVGCSQTRDRIHVSCIGRRILYHWAPGEVLVMRKLRLRESMRRSWGHCFLGGDRRALHNSEYEWQIQTWPWARVATQPLWRTHSLKAVASLPRIIIPSESGEWQGATSLPGKGWKDMGQPSGHTHSDGLSSSWPCEEHCPTQYRSEAKPSATGTWSCPRAMMGGAMRNDGRSHVTAPPKAQLLLGENKDCGAARRGQTRERVHTHTPDLEEGSSLLQVTQQMGRRIPAQGDHTYSIHTVSYIHIPGRVICDL